MNLLLQHWVHSPLMLLMILYISNPAIRRFHPVRSIFYLDRWKDDTCLKSSPNVKMHLSVIIHIFLPERSVEEGEAQAQQEAGGSMSGAFVAGRNFCPPGWSIYGNRCFNFFNSPRPWIQAEVGPGGSTAKCSTSKCYLKTLNPDATWEGRVSFSKVILEVSFLLCLSCSVSLSAFPLSEQLKSYPIYLWRKGGDVFKPNTWF